MKEAMEDLYTSFIGKLLEVTAKAKDKERRVGAEMKFPLVNIDGSAVDRETVQALWRHLAQCGWTLEECAATGNVTGARKPGEQNDTVAGCETGYAKTEFAMAHVADLNKLAEDIDVLRDELAPFAAEHDVRFLGYGIHPVSLPGEDLLEKKGRTSVWTKVFPSNEVIPEERGDDMHMFTINAGSHVHVSVSEDEAIPLVNVLTGFAGAQIALTADSSVWRNDVGEYRSVSEKFWDWWEPAEGRVGVPEHPFKDARDYLESIVSLKPVFVKRDGKPIVLKKYSSFIEYYSQDQAEGEDADGHPVTVTPRPEDLDVHNSCYWYNARISRYFTVENRVFDQQPPETLICPAALTLGLVSALDAAQKELAKYDWADLRMSRDVACAVGMNGFAGAIPIASLCRRVLDIAAQGLESRGLGEERFLSPLRERLVEKRCPADGAQELFEQGGVEKLVEKRAFTTE